MIPFCGGDGTSLQSPSMYNELSYRTITVIVIVIVIVDCK